MMLAIILFWLLSEPCLVTALCECGYRTSAGDRFSHRLFNNFTKVNDVDSTDEQGLMQALPHWYIMRWRTEGDPELNTIPRQNEVSNVWIKDGELHLRQRAHIEGNTDAVSVAELNSKQDDILHGSFRMTYKVEYQPLARGGSIAGFFFYHNDTEESDIEILTQDGADWLQYTNHPAYNPKTDTLTKGASFRHDLAKPLTEYQEQRLDWTKDITRYYQAGVHMQDISMNVPQHHGKIMINLWANNGSWSGPPSTGDVVLSVRNVELYFNTTATDAGLNETFNKICADAGGFLDEDAICSPGEPQELASSSRSIRSYQVLHFTITFALGVMWYGVG